MNTAHLVFQLTYVAVDRRRLVGIDQDSVSTACFVSPQRRLHGLRSRSQIGMPFDACAINIINNNNIVVTACLASSMFARFVLRTCKPQLNVFQVSRRGGSLGILHGAYCQTLFQCAGTP